MAATTVHDVAAHRGAFRAGDLLGGLAAAAVLLPQAMAFGVALYAMGGMPAAAGAYAALAGTALACLASGASGGTRGLISAPTGPTLVLLGGVVTALVARGLDGAQVLLGLGATMALAGVVQFLIGLARGGRLIKYIPYPVVSGFMTGSAILMCLSQQGPLTGADPGAAWLAWTWLPALTAAVTIVVAWATSALAPRVPGPIAGLIGGTGVFHAIAAANPAPLPQAWMIGTVPGPQWPSFELTLGTFTALPLEVIAPAAAALAVLASLDTLLTAVVADVATGTRHDARTELMGQGSGMMLAGLLGGMSGAGTTGATVVAVKSGGGRWVGVVTGLTFVLLVTAGGEVGRLLPIGALAGVILYVAFGIADRDILAWARRGRTRQDAAIAVLVTLITVLWDLMIAVGIGVAIAILLFIREQIRAPVVHRRSTGAQMRSVRRRPEQERAVLDDNGHRIVVFELRGNLFFGTTDRLIDELGADLDQPNWLILHLRRVTRIDLTALKLLRQVAERLYAHGGMLMCCDVHHGIGVGDSLRAALDEADDRPLTAPVMVFNGRDEALEFAENALLEVLEFARTKVSDQVPLAGNGIAAYMSATDVSVLTEQLVTRRVERETAVFEAGGEGDELLLVVSGEVEVRVRTTAHHSKRLATYGPGTFFGELALLAGGRRAADAVTTRPTELLALSRASYETIKRDHPETAVAMLSAICGALVTNQRWSTSEIQRLAEW